jgi:hypothetical protein
LIDIVLLIFKVTFTFEELLFCVLPFFSMILLFYDAFYYELLFKGTELFTGVVLFLVFEELLLVEFTWVLEELLVVFTGVVLFLVFEELLFVEFTWVLEELLVVFTGVVLFLVFEELLFVEFTWVLEEFLVVVFNEELVVLVVLVRF